MATPVWEKSKENAAPLERGRNVLDFEKSQSRSQAEVDQIVNKHETLVRPSEDPDATGEVGDPLALWLSYIKEYQDLMPSDTHNQFLLMERCTRALIKMDRYANDDRYIRVCARYAGKTRDPGQVFKLMHQRKVGTYTATFWAAWAFVSEKEGEFSFADQAFKKGISKKAQPLKMLKIRYQQFLRRFSRHLKEHSDQSRVADEYDETPSDGQRRALGGLSTGTIRSNDRQSHRASRGLQRQTLSDRPRARRGAAGSFSIFVESPDENQQPGYDLDASFQEPSKRIMGRESDNRKENTLFAERWNERGGLSAPGPSQASPADAPVDVFQVFVDEECTAQQRDKEKQTEAKLKMNREIRDERTFKEMKPGMADKLAKDPMRYVRNPGKLESDQVRSQCDIRKSQSEKVERLHQASGIKASYLTDSFGQEQCVEEASLEYRKFSLVPANMAVNLLRSPLTTAGGFNDNSEMEMDDDHPLEKDLTPICFDPSRNAVTQSDHTKLNQSADVSANRTYESASNSIANSLPPRTPRFGHGREEETINTKFAMKELSMMFASPNVDGAQGAENDASCSNIVEMMGNLAMNNSVIGFDSSEEKRHEGSVVCSSISSCHQPRRTGEKDVADPSQLTGRVNPSNSLGFQIFNDVEELTEEVTEPNIKERSSAVASGSSFSIFNDTDDDHLFSREEPKEGLERFGSLADITEVEDSGSVDECVNPDISFNCGVYPTSVIPMDGDTKGPAAVTSFKIFVDESHEDVAASKHSRTDFDASMENRPRPTKRSRNEVFDYVRVHNEDIDKSLRCVTKGHSSKNEADFCLPLASLLTRKGRIYTWRQVFVPKKLKKKKLKKRDQFILGGHSGIVKAEFGRGAYGIVALLGCDVGDETHDVTIKIQTPLGCLAWEYEVLNRLHARVFRENRASYPFPEPNAFVLLADGGILSTKPLSGARRNLVDLVNLYRKAGQPVPEIIVFHYTSRMLSHIEMLHDQGRILHCDVKPDNFVLGKVFDPAHPLCGVPGSDLFLVDFGRAVDLDDCCRSGNGPQMRGVEFTGTATREDMRCVAMRTGLPWSYDIDTYGIVASFHVLLHGTHLEIEKREEQWYPTLPLKRYWQQGLWKELYLNLLNPDISINSATGPRPEEIRKLRGRIDDYLDENQDRLTSAIAHQAAIFDALLSEK